MERERERERKSKEKGCRIETVEKTWRDKIGGGEGANPVDNSWPSP